MNLKNKGYHQLLLTKLLILFTVDLHSPPKFIIFAIGKNAKVFFPFLCIDGKSAVKACKKRGNLSLIAF